MEETIEQQVCEVTQLYQTDDRFARTIEAHMVREAMQWLGMTEWLENRQPKWNDRYKYNVQKAMGITEMTVKVLTNATVAKAAPAQETRKEEKDMTAWQHRGSLETSQHGGPTQDIEPEKRQLQHQPKPKPKLQLQQQSEPQHEAKPKPTPALARRWQMVRPQTLSLKAPPGPGLARQLAEGWQSNP